MFAILGKRERGTLSSRSFIIYVTIYDLAIPACTKD